MSFSTTGLKNYKVCGRVAEEENLYWRIILMSKKQSVVTIFFSINVTFSRARGIMKEICDKCSPPLAYKKYKTIQKGNIALWRKGMNCLVGYRGKGEQCVALCSFVDEKDAESFENYLNDYLYKNRYLNDEILLIE